MDITLPLSPELITGVFGAVIGIAATYLKSRKDTRAAGDLLERVVTAYDQGQTRTLPADVAPLVDERSWTMSDTTRRKVLSLLDPAGRQIAETTILSNEARRNVRYTIITPRVWFEIEYGALVNWGYTMEPWVKDTLVLGLTPSETAALLQQVRDAERSDIDEYVITLPKGWARVLNGRVIETGGEFAPQPGVARPVTSTPAEGA